MTAEEVGYMRKPHTMKTGEEAKGAVKLLEDLVCLLLLNEKIVTIDCLF